MFDSFWDKVKTLDLFSFKNRTDLFFAGISIALLVTTIIWALGLEMNYDEAFSYRAYAKNIGRFLKMNLANNHPLNSIFIFFTSFFFPYSEFAIRLPNILFLIVYLIFAVAISKEYESRLLTFGLLVFYGYLIPGFFSQARGYGIAASLVLTSMYIIKKRPSSNYIVMSVYIMLSAAYTYVALVPLFVALIIDFLIVDLKKDVVKFIRDNKIHVVIWSIIFIYVVYFLSSVSQDGKPLYGAYNTTFLQSVLGSYLECFFFKLRIVNNLTLFIPSLILLIYIVYLLSTQFKALKIVRICLMTFAMIYLAAKAMDKPFPTNRLLLPYWPLVVLAVVEILDISFKKILKLNTHVIKWINISLFFGLVINYGLKYKPLNTSNYYRSQILQEFNINVKPFQGKWNATIAFYKDKDQYYGILPKKLLQVTPDQTLQLNQDLSLMIYSDKNLLLFQSAKPLDDSTKFILEMSPLSEHIIEQDESSEKEVLTFKWADRKYAIQGKEYHLIQLPNNTRMKIVLKGLNNNEVLFESTAKFAGANAAGALLTGMGADGATGLLSMRNAGAFTIAQDEATSVVWGMPGEAVKAGAAMEVLPLDKVTQRMLDFASGKVKGKKAA